jgi:hypothetical protein
MYCSGWQKQSFRNTSKKKLRSGSLLVELLCYAWWHILMDKIFKLFSLSTFHTYCLVPHIIPSVESSPVVGNAFTVSCNDWKEGTCANFNDWALKQFDFKEFDSDDEAEVPVHMMKAKDIKFERNDRKELILPPISNYRTVRQKQRVIRAYIGAVYRQSIQYI